MNSSSASLALAAHLALLSSISFGGFPTVLPDVHNVAVANGWVTDQEFANFFAVSQVMPGPNMILMMSFLGLAVGGIPGATIAALATFGPPCLMYYLSYRLWDRFRGQWLGVALPQETEIRVWDSTSEMRYLVLPMRPAGTEGWSEERLAALVTRDSMIGTRLPLNAEKLQ